MKKLLSLTLAVMMLMAIMPTVLVSAQDEPSSYWIDRDAESGYVGNYTLISNGETSTSKKMTTGDLSDACVTDTQEENENSASTIQESAAADDDDVVLMTLPTEDAEKPAADTKATNQTHRVGESSYWYYLADAYQMYEDYVSVRGTTFTCRAAGEYCYIWAETHTESASIQIPTSEAEALAAEFDRVYASVINSFGEFDTASGDTKVNILVHNLSEGISSYFYKFEFESLGNNGFQYMFHVDNSSTMVDSGGNWDVTAGFEPMLSAFTDMVIYLRAREKAPVWLTQVLRQAAIGNVYGETATEKRIENWTEATSAYTNGKSLYDWEKSNLDLDPTYHYMFAQYLKAQYGTYEIFGNLLDLYAAGTDPTGATFIPQVLQGTALEGKTLAETIEAYRIALVVKDDKAGSMYGFGGNEIFNNIPVNCYTGTGLELQGGAAVLVQNLESGIFTPPADAHADLGYVGIATDLEALPSVHCVIFWDTDGTILKEQLVFTGDDAIPPADPYHEGYTFIGWDTDYTNVQESLDITAQYEEGETYHVITMVNEDDNVEIGTLRVIRGFAPDLSEKPVRSGYAFLGWYDENGDPFDTTKPVYDDITIYARWIPAVTMYAYTFDGYTFSSFSTEDPSAFTSHSNIDNNLRFLYAGAYLNGNIYGFNDLNNFVKIDAETYESVIVSEGATTNSDIYRCLDMTYDYPQRIMYISYIDIQGQGHIGSVNLETGKITSVATTATYYMGIACNKEGALYAVLPDGLFVSVNEETGRYNMIGDTGVSLTFDGTVNFTAITFDYDTGRLYWPAMDGETEETYLYLIDTNDGSVINLGRVAEDYQLHALYIPYTYDVNTYYTVNFVDYDGTILSTQRVIEGGDAQAPEDPVREGYRFVGWDTDFTNVQSDLRVVAQYEALAAYTVTFADWDFSVISTQTVYEGHDAVAPEDPVRDGYTFVGWSVDFTNVQSDLLIIAQYVEGTIEYELGDCNRDGTVNTGDAVAVLRHIAEIIVLDDVQLQLADFNGDGVVNTGDAVAILKACVA